MLMSVLLLSMSYSIPVSITNSSLNYTHRCTPVISDICKLRLGGGVLTVLELPGGMGGISPPLPIVVPGTITALHMVSPP